MRSRLLIGGLGVFFLAGCGTQVGNGQNDKRWPWERKKDPETPAPTAEGQTGDEGAGGANDPSPPHAGGVGMLSKRLLLRPLLAACGSPFGEDVVLPAAFIVTNPASSFGPVELRLNEDAFVEIALAGDPAFKLRPNANASYEIEAWDLETGGAVTGYRCGPLTESLAEGVLVRTLTVFEEDQTALEVRWRVVPAEGSPGEKARLKTVEWRYLHGGEDPVFFMHALR